MKQERRSYHGEEDSVAGVSMLEQQSSQDIDGESYSKKKKAKKKKKRKKDTQSHNDTLLSSLSASDMSHSEGTVTPGTAFSKTSKRKRRHSNRDAASTSDASVHASPAKAKRGRHLQDGEGSGTVAVVACKGEEAGLHSNFSEATNAVEHCTKSNKKHQKSSQKKHRRKHSHCQE